jgi:tetratricopeptide (TPR) repeat protein
MVVWFARSLSYLLMALVLNGCGSGTNPFRYLILESDRESFEYLYDKARAEFDAGQLQSALTSATEALRINRRSEKAALLYGFVNLALAGADPFSIAKALVGRSSNPETKQPLALGSKDFSIQVFQSLLIEESDDPLTFLQEVVGLTDAEIRQLADVDEDITDLPLLIPRCVETVRQEAWRLQYLNLAIIAVCPFIDEELRVPQDYRQVCEVTDLPRHKSNEAHFLWSFAHLTEALVFNAVLTYRGSNAPTAPTNFEQRVKRLKEANQVDPGEFIKAVDRIQLATEKILPINDKCAPQTPTSQLRATLLDLMAVERGFAKLPSIPNKIVDPLKRGISGIVQAGGSAVSFRGDFTKKISQDLSEKIDQVVAEKNLSASEIEKICQDFDRISAGTQVISNTCKK